MFTYDKSTYYTLDRNRQGKRESDIDIRLHWILKVTECGLWGFSSYYFYMMHPELHISTRDC